MSASALEERAQRSYTDASAWGRRLVMAALALCGFVVAGYLGLYQLGVIHTVWDPLFGADSRTVLHSPIERLLPLPDAALGAIAYLVEIGTDFLGGSSRWRRQPWAVLVFGVVVGALALTAIVLVSIQAFYLRAFCTLCLVSAGISLVVAALAVEEVLATVDWLRMETGLGRPVRDAVLHGDRLAIGRIATAPPVRRHRLEPPDDGAAGNGLAVQATNTRPSGDTDNSDTAQTHSQERRDMGDDIDRTELGQAGETGATQVRPGGPDVDGGNEELWRGPDRSTGEKGRPGGVVAITGAAAGVGRAAVREFAKHGYDVGLIARDRDSLENAKAEVESCGGRALVCAIDVADAAAVDQAAQQIEEQLGPIDVWVNDAMVSVFAPVKEMTADDYRRVTEVNYLGYVNGTLAALKRMLPRDRGVVIHVGSALAYRAIPLQSAYCASKHAIQGFHESLRTELIHDKSHVRTTMVQMPALNTPQFDWVESRLPNKPQPVPPIYQPEVAAEAIYWAAHHERREVVVGVTTWGAIQLNKLVPGMLDWYLGRTGYKSQQTAEPDDPNRPNDVRRPVAGDHGAHGRFDSRSTATSAQLWATTHRPVVAGAVGAAGLAILGAFQLASSLMHARNDR